MGTPGQELDTNGSIKPTLRTAPVLDCSLVQMFIARREGGQDGATRARQDGSDSKQDGAASAWQDGSDSGQVRLAAPSSVVAHKWKNNSKARWK